MRAILLLALAVAVVPGALAQLLEGTKSTTNQNTLQTASAATGLPSGSRGGMVEITQKDRRYRNADEQLEAVRGVLPGEDSQDMLRSVEEGSELVDPDAWRSGQGFPNRKRNPNVRLEASSSRIVPG